MISKQNFETVRPFLEFQVKDRGSLVGLGSLELPTSPLSGVRSNQAELQTHLRGARILLKNNYLRKAFTVQIAGPETT